ncbi:MAG: peptidase [Sphingomonas bacterium]|jgi:hypothetical protein|nr:peptidase [Sphingomonas bacterium]
MPSRQAAIRAVLLFAVLVLVIWLGVRAATPPAALPLEAPATSFSATRAILDVQAIAIRPHPTGTADNARVSAYLAARLAQIGLQSFTRHYLIEPKGLERLRTWSHGTSKASELTDVIGILPGRDRAAPAVVLMAHYDTVWGSPGGGDDSAGIASALEIVRAIKARDVPARDVILLFTDGEEIGLSGARAFWGGDKLADHAGVVINLEARGAGGRATMFETGADNGAMMRLFAQGVAAPVANSLAVLAYRKMPNDTDLTPVRERGLPGFNFAIMGRAAYYHSPLATRDRLDPRSLQDMGAQGLGIASVLAFAPTLPAKAADATFFDVLGGHFVVYPMGAGWLLLLGAGLALAAAWASVRVRPVELLAGLGGALWLASHALLGLTVFNLLSGSARHPNYYDRLAALPGLEAIAALVALAAIGGFLILRTPARRWIGALPALAIGLLGWLLGGPHALLLAPMVIGIVMSVAGPRGGVSLWGGWIGGAALLLLLAVAAQIEAAGAAWLLAWPALILSVAAAIAAWADPRFDRGIGAAVAAIAAVLVAAPLLPLAHLTFLGIGGPIPQAMAPFVLMAGIALWPVGRMPATRPMALAIACALVAAGTIAIHVRIAPLAPSVPGYSLDK